MNPPTGVTDDDVMQARMRLAGSHLEARQCLADHEVALLIKAASDTSFTVSKLEQQRPGGAQRAHMAMFDQMAEAIERLMADLFNGRIKLFRAALADPGLFDRMSVIASSSDGLALTREMIQHDLLQFESNVHIVAESKPFTHTAE